MGKSAKFFKRPTRKEKAVMSLTKGTSETSLFDSVNQGRKGTTKDILSATANPTISKKSSTGASTASTSAHPPKASLAYKMQLNGGIKQAVKDLQALDGDDDEELMEEDDDMEGGDDTNNNKEKKKQNMDKTQPRPDYVELMYGKPQSGNKRKTFKPKPALIK
ncbi:hypothetical protein BGZ80_007338 [Entomortierella chlamydospora]|uniref:Uncharacterized protein n=1 Tax=Entomortierella chlamydospora TaxID=101097 RepID=A0A9P6SS48_9FUNG|nr:hypothetical protein BGZ80_007338 [Entomortierella chlamydospora]KAF9996574.1 hypothetical protein BGZ79_009688 [Entomortierella chlamydospora]